MVREITMTTTGTCRKSGDSDGFRAHAATRPVAGGEGVWVAVSEQGFCRTRNLLMVIPTRESVCAEELIHNLCWMRHTLRKLPCENWKS
jgi:hypothetical protein